MNEWQSLSKYALKTAGKTRHFKGAPSFKPLRKREHPWNVKFFQPFQCIQCILMNFAIHNYNILQSGLLIFRGKKSKISRDFPGQIRGKIGRFRGIFAGKKSKFAEQSADFVGFSQEKSQNSQKKRPISREISGGNFAKKQSVKNSRFRWFFFGKFR